MSTRSGSALAASFVLIVGLLTLTPSLASGAGTGKQGAKCSKVGSTRGALICARVGTRTVWVKRVVKPKPAAPTVTPSASPTATPTSTVRTVRFNLKADCGTAVNPCPATDVQGDVSIESCRMRDLSGSPDAGMSSGFPRPSYARVGVASPRVLLVPVSFSDLAFEDPDRELSLERERTRQFYLRSSYGKVDVQWVLPAVHLRVDATVAAFRDRHRDDPEAVTAALLARVDAEVIQEADALVLITPRSASISWGGLYGGVLQSRSGPLLTYLYIGGEQRWGLAHILGHTLYALPDLYLSHPFTLSGLPVPKDLLFYDIMANGFSDDFVGWHRWVSGWLAPPDVHCIAPMTESTTRYLRFLDDRSGARLLMIPTAPGRMLLAEYRAASAGGYCCDTFDENGRGLLVYLFDSTIRQGFGQMRMVDAPRLLVNGESGELQGWRLTVRAADAHGVYVSVQRQR